VTPVVSMAADEAGPLGDDHIGHRLPPARPLRRTIQREIEDALSERILLNESAQDRSARRPPSRRSPFPVQFLLVFGSNIPVDPRIMPGLAGGGGQREPGRTRGHGGTRAHPRYGEPGAAGLGGCRLRGCLSCCSRRRRCTCTAANKASAKTLSASPSRPRVGRRGARPWRSGLRVRSVRGGHVRDATGWWRSPLACDRAGLGRDRRQRAGRGTSRVGRPDDVARCVCR
jgi:hypothetical protein